MCFVLFVLVVMYLVNLCNLVFGVLENMNVGEKENEDGIEYCNVGKNKSVGYKVNNKEKWSEIRRKDLD